MTTTRGRCPHSGMSIEMCKRVDICDCFDFPEPAPSSAVTDEMRAAMRAGLAAHPLAPAVPLDGDIAEIEWAAADDQPVSRNRGMRRPGGWTIYGDVEIADALILSVRPLSVVDDENDA